MFIEAEDFAAAVGLYSDYCERRGYVFEQPSESASSLLRCEHFNVIALSNSKQTLALVRIESDGSGIAIADPDEAFEEITPHLVTTRA